MPQLWAGFLNWFPTSHLISSFLLLGPSADAAGRGDDRLWLLGSGANLASTFAYHVIMLQKSSDGGNAKKSLHQNWLSIILHPLSSKCFIPFHPRLPRLPRFGWTHVTVVGIWPS
jgi:hypothetical protein